MWIVTGGAGFIGSNIVQALNGKGHSDILIVDRPKKDFGNLRDLRFADLLQPEEFVEILHRKALPPGIEAILHQGACADTTCADERFMMDNNVSFSKAVLHFAIERKIPLVYASSAATYGANINFKESPENEAPLNLYGRSKLIFDNYVRTRHLKSQRTRKPGAFLRFFRKLDGHHYGFLRKHFREAHSLIERAGFKNQHGEGSGIVEVFRQLLHERIA